MWFSSFRNMYFEIGKKRDNRETGPMNNEGHKMTNKVNVKSTHAHKTSESQFPVCESFTAFF